MSQRIPVCAWGVWVQNHELPAYAMADPDGIESDAARVAAAIARKAGLHAVIVRQDCTCLSGDRVVAYQYQITLGSPCSCGGWNLEGEVWIEVPR